MRKRHLPIELLMAGTGIAPDVVNAALKRCSKRIVPYRTPTAGDRTETHLGLLTVLFRKGGKVR